MIEWVLSGINTRDQAILESLMPVSTCFKVLKIGHTATNPCHCIAKDTEKIVFLAYYQIHI